MGSHRGAEPAPPARARRGAGEEAAVEVGGGGKVTRRLSRHSTLGTDERAGWELEPASGDEGGAPPLEAPEGADEVPLEARELPKTFEGLREHQTALEARLAALAEQDPRTNLADAVRLCRGFGEALRRAMKAGGAPGGGADEGVAVPPRAAIRSLFEGELAEQWASLDTSAVFAVDNVRKAVRASDGFAPHLLAPEPAIRKLIKQALDQYAPPAQQAVQAVAAVLTAACEAALDDLKAREWDGDYPKLTFRLREVCVESITAWSKEASGMVDGIVQMEQDMPSYKYFRDIARDRALRPAGGGALASHPVATDGGADGYAGLAKKEYLMGFLEKRDYSRQRWQRRWCVLSEDKKQLFYFGNPNDRKPRAVVDLAEAVLVSEVKTPRALRGGATSAQLILRLVPLDAAQPILPPRKNGTARVSLTLRAPNTDSKTEWVVALRRLCRERGPETPKAVPEDERLEAELSPRLQRANALKVPSASAPVDLITFGVGTEGEADDESDGEEAELSESDRDEAENIAQIGAPLGLSARDGRTLHLVVPALLPAVAAGENLTESALAEAYIAQFAQDTSTYCEGVAKSLGRSVPKAIMRLLVQQVEESMEDALMARVVKLGDYDIASALERDPAAGQKKLEVVKALAKAELRLLDLGRAGERAFEPIDTAQ